ncbi:TRAP transporter small permease [Alkalibacter rhizosphaerae]|uniref:TRAP transporter small permease n=1 Tax=Alkalibacter rhizosphaerae TaxID=2815577 RepID=A0A975AH72_9FIRM|nr:TRAP transporter small permease [Alkalibacter rhizosphaerae]QSX07703.1 TRAP transporter small permease [Alkalibacter rhizosphaerae]
MKKIVSWLDVNFEPIFMTIIFFSMMGLVTLQVILRFFFKMGFSWGEELAKIMFVWLMYFSFSYATRNQRHINITYLTDKLNDTLRKIVMIFVDLAFGFFMAVALLAAFKVTKSASINQDMLVTIKISLNIIYGAGILGFVMMLLRVTQNLIWKIKRIKEPIEVFANEGGVLYNNEIVFGTVRKLGESDQEKAPKSETGEVK